MGLKEINTSRSISFGFHVAFANLRFFAPLIIGAALVSFIVSLLVSSITDSAIVSRIVDIVIYSIIALMLFKICLGFIDNQQLSRKDLFGSNELLLNYVAASLIFWILTYIGLLLFIIPGIYILVTYGFYGLEIVDRGLGPRDALNRSAELTKGSRWNMLWMGIELYFGSILISVALFLLSLVFGALIGVIMIFLQASHILTLSGESQDALWGVAYISVILLTGASIVSIVIPSYALAFVQIYREFEPKRSLIKTTIPEIGSETVPDTISETI